MKFRSTGETFIAIAIYLLGFYLCLPIAMIFLNSVLIYMLVFSAAALIIGGLVLLNRKTSLVLFLFLFICTIFYWQITWRTQLDEVSFVYYCFASLSFIFGGMVLYASKNEGLIKRLFFYLTAIYLITAITSIIGLKVYPLAARELGRGATYNTSLDFNTYKNIYRSMNIASWSQIYGMLFAVPASLMVWRREKSPFYLVLCVALVWAIIASQITFAVLMALAFIVVMYLPRKRNAKTIITVLFFILIAGLILVNLDSILTVAINLSRNKGFSFLTIKLSDLKILLVQKNVVGDAEARSDLYQTSLNTFFKNLLFGLIADGKATSEKIGFHSEFFDLLGTFGISCLLILVVSCIGYWRFLENIKNDTRRDLRIILIGFLALFVLNPVFNSPQIFIGAFLYPILSSKYCGFKKDRRISI